ncbi:helix-turn-helix domain-containing protein [Cognatilysobacter terrigena]|uniref:helix-turn-helix domain-containing protein n=1 Tax=Cognatilysobacter terrigena TaxID=2488749 RepID=UPI001414D02B|nr:helix-turn-helix transcriptional regulator [Lysobacter terrigena]
MQHVANYFTVLVDASPKTQDEIAREAGFESPNTISMIKTGRTKIPLARIPALAKSLGADPKEMLAVALESYQPELYDVLSKIAPSMLISEQELRIVRALRAAARTGILK